MGEDLLWIPRVVLFPIYVISDYVVRRPLGAATMAVETNDVIPRVMYLFTFGPNHNAGLIPTGFYDFGFRPSVGLYFFYDDFLAPNNALRATISTGGLKWLKAKVADRIPLRVVPDEAGKPVVKSYVQLEADGLDRPDLGYWGVGYDTLDAERGRFEERTAGIGARFHVDFWKGTFLESWLTLRKTTFSDGDCSAKFFSFANFPSGHGVRCDVATMMTQVHAGTYPIPPGFERGYSSTKAGGRLVLDSRAPRPLPGSGVVLDVRGELGTAFAGSEGSWVSYAATAGGFIDLTGTRRVLGLSIDARFVDALPKTFAIPFTELVGAPRVDYVPEDDMMRGFVPGRLLGESSLAATLEYEWPIWAFADGTVQLAAGNTFGHHLEDFAFDRARLSFVAGITSPNHRDHAFNLLFGFGTKPFAQRAAPESFRFILGGTTGF